MQRIILIDYHANIRDNKTVENYNKLTHINREGLTHLTGWLLQFRTFFVKHYEDEFDKRFAEFKKLCSDDGIIVPDRMCENYALILTTYEVLTIAGIRLPFMPGELKKFMISTIRAQAGKRDVGSVTKIFWDIVLQLANERIIRNGKEFKFNGNKLSIRWTEIHGMYMEKHQRQYRSPGLGKSTMLQKLKDSGTMISDSKEKYSVNGESRQVSFHSYVFEYDKLGIDLLGLVDYYDSQDQKYARKEDRDGENEPEKVTHVTRSDPTNNPIEST